VQCRLWAGGLLGGKGGFGAMLRAAAKQAGNKPTRYKLIVAITRY
jgi:Silencing defective 2 N-terminal ubiquitin domain